MDDNSNSEVEVEPYDKIVNLNYRTPITSSASSPFCYEEDQLNNAQLHGPIVNSSESEVVSASTGLVASVTWPDLRYPCSLAGSYQELRLLKHSDANRATLAPNVGPEDLSTPAGFSQHRPDTRLEVKSKHTRIPERIFSSEGYECQSIPTSLPENRSRTVRLQTPAVEDDCQPVVESVAMSKDVEFLTVSDDPARLVSALFLTAIVANVNALWRAFCGRTPVAPLGVDATKHADEVHVYPVVRNDGVETDGQTASTSRRFWRLDSDIEIDLDRVPVPVPSAELDLTIPQHTTNADSETLRISILKD